MNTLSECLGHEPGFFNIVLDIMLRRGIITPTAAAHWATSVSVLESVHTTYWPHKHLEVCTFLCTYFLCLFLFLFLFSNGVTYISLNFLFSS